MKELFSDRIAERVKNLCQICAVMNRRTCLC